MGKPTDTPKPKRRRGTRGLTREDAALWRHVAEGIRPLPGRFLVEAEPDGPEIAPLAPKRAKSRKPAPSPVPPPMATAAVSLPELGHGEVAGVDKRTAQRMRRGQMRIEGRLDLHGLTQEEAHRAVTSFIAGSQASGRRCVLIVTGKGLKPDGRTGVLRANVPHWLNLPPNRARVLAFSYAAPKDGGEGALYVLLRRAR